MTVLIYESEIEWYGVYCDLPSFSGYLVNIETGQRNDFQTIIPRTDVDERERHLIRLGLRFYYMAQFEGGGPITVQVTMIRPRVDGAPADLLRTPLL